MCFSIINIIIQALVAIGTVGTLIASVYQIKREKRLRVEEGERAQAINVAAWFESVSLVSKMPGNQYNAYRTALIRNDNLTPIYNVVVTVVGLHGAGPSRNGEDNSADFPFRIVLPQIAAGLWGAWIDTGGSGMGVVCALEIAFRDGNGKSWVRRGNGCLEEIKEDPLKYYSIPLPAFWTHAERIEQ